MLLAAKNKIKHEAAQWKGPKFHNIHVKSLYAIQSSKRAHANQITFAQYSDNIIDTNCFPTEATEFLIL